MISVKRAAVAAPVELDFNDPASKGFLERDQAIQLYSVAANKDKKFTYKVYKVKPVQEKLEELFRGKCAYCESKYVATQPLDVEHYRPKGAIHINGKLETPGYYWLACEWTNLLPSCIDCNRERQQTLPDGTKINAGKKNYFPVTDESRRWRRHADQDREQRLLLDPCRDEPARHLEFTGEGLVRPALSPAGRTSKKGDTSIKVYGLQRRGLVERRRERALLVLAQIERVRELTADFAQNPTSTVIEARLKREMKVLKEFTKPEREYAGMARQLVNDFLDSL